MPRTTLSEIRIDGVRGFGRHGVLPDEKIRGQEFIVDVRMWLPTKKAGRTDQLEYTVDYAAVAVAVHEIIVGPPVELIETLAERIAARVLEFRRIHKVEIKVHKPLAPIPVDFQDVSITILRERG